MSHRHVWVCSGCGQERSGDVRAGGGHHNALLSDLDVALIRRSLKGIHPPTLAELATEHSVSRETISLAARGVTYRDVAEPPVPLRGHFYRNKRGSMEMRLVGAIANHVRHHVKAGRPCNCSEEVMQTYKESRNAQDRV